MTTYTSIRNLFLVIAAGGLIACSSSSDTPATTTVSGTVFAAPVNGASVSVTDGSGNPVAGPVITTSAGAFSIAIPNTALASELVFESTGLRSGQPGRLLWLQRHPPLAGLGTFQIAAVGSQRGWLYACQPPALVAAVAGGMSEPPDRTFVAYEH